MKLDRDRLVEQLVELIRRASTELPPDVKKALEAGRDSEPDGSTARRTLTMMLENQTLRRALHAPVDPEALVGDSPPMRAVKTLIRKVGPTRANVLIAGGASTVQQHLRAGLVESSSCTSRPSSWGAVNGCWRTSGTPGWSRSVWSRRRRDPR